MILNDLKVLQEEIERTHDLLKSNLLSAEDRNIVIRYIIKKAITLLMESEDEIRKGVLRQQLMSNLN